MLIFERSRNNKPIVKYLFILFIMAALGACGDNKDESQTASEVVKPEDRDRASIESIDDEPKSTPLPATSIDDVTPETDQIEDTPARDLPPVEDSPIKDNKSLVEGLGFSGAQNGDDTVEKLDESSLFCLDNKDESENKLSIEDACRKISKRLASVKYDACEAASLQKTGCSSVKGFPILMTEFAPVKERAPQGRILIVGGTHGDELTSVSMTLRWIEKLNNHHSGLFHWHLIPMMNPDGVLKSGATRTNENGVDLNRNMPSDDWKQNAIKYWKEKGGENPRKYPGESASSEPETQWLIDEIKTFKPDAIISVHAPYGVVDFDSLLLNTAPKSLGKLHLNLLGTYPGSLGNYAGINRNIPVITLELPHSWIMPSEAESTKIWEDIVRWLKQNVNTEVAQN